MLKTSHKIGLALLGLGLALSAPKAAKAQTYSPIWYEKVYKTHHSTIQRGPQLLTPWQGDSVGVVGLSIYPDSNPMYGMKLLRIGDWGDTATRPFIMADTVNSSTTDGYIVRNPAGGFAQIYSVGFWVDSFSTIYWLADSAGGQAQRKRVMGGNITYGPIATSASGTTVVAWGVQGLNAAGFGHHYDSTVRIAGISAAGDSLFDIHLPMPGQHGSGQAVAIDEGANEAWVLCMYGNNPTWSAPTYSVVRVSLAGGAMLSRNDFTIAGNPRLWAASAAGGFLYAVGDQGNPPLSFAGGKPYACKMAADGTLAWTATLPQPSGAGTKYTGFFTACHLNSQGRLAYAGQDYDSAAVLSGGIMLGQLDAATGAMLWRKRTTTKVSNDRAHACLSFDSNVVVIGGRPVGNSSTDQDLLIMRHNPSSPALLGVPASPFAANPPQVRYDAGRVMLAWPDAPMGTSATLVDMLGRTIGTIPLNSWTSPTVAPGCYIAVITAKGQRSSLPIIISN